MQSLVGAVASTAGDFVAALNLYETQIRPIVQKLLDAAAKGAEWYERFEQNMKLPPWEFANEYISRSGRLDPDRVASTSPKFVQRYNRWKFRAAQR